MTIFLYPFLILAGVGFALSLLVHLLALLGFELPQEITLLDTGVIAIWIPTLLLSNFVRHGLTRRFGWKHALNGCPRWMRFTVYGLFAYMFLSILFVNFLRFGTSSPTGPQVVSAQWLGYYASAFALLYSALHRPKSLKNI